MCLDKEGAGSLSIRIQKYDPELLIGASSSRLMGNETLHVVIRCNRKQCHHHLPHLVPRPRYFDGVMTSYISCRFIAQTTCHRNITKLANLGLQKAIPAVYQVS